MTTLEELPLVLTVEEAAAVLRISRAAAYEQARIWRETDGRDGLPVVVIGHCLRVPRAKLEDKLGCESASPDGAAPPGASLHLAP
ncbi:MAG: helix-turn-helix domain-containing protein [Acidimicrobiales bacterium]